MAKIVPIKGMRFSPACNDELAHIITPPYDVITQEGQEKYYQKNPYNIIRLEYGKSLPQDTPGNNKYTRAAETLAKWLEKGILLQEKTPAIYLYEQHFQYEQQTYIRNGIYCGVGLSPFEEGVIIPHEKTMSKPKVDRLQLLRHCETNFSPIFGLFQDQEQFVATASLAYKENQEPILNFEDEEGQRHKVWAVTDTGFFRLLGEFFQDKNIFIADGHHRYETALQFYLEKRKRENKAGSYAHVLMALVNLYDEGLLVFPTHRVVTQDLIAPGSLLKELKHCFQIKELPAPAGPDHLQAILAEHLTGASQQQLALGLYAPGKKFFILLYKDGKKEGKIFPWLDTVVLQEMILSKIFNLDGIEEKSSSVLAYLKDEWEAKLWVDSGQACYAFFINKPPLEKIIDLAVRGFRIPQKSTFFFPKFMTGIIMLKLV